MSEAKVTKREMVESIVEITDTATGEKGFVRAFGPTHARKVALAAEIEKLMSRFSARKVGAIEALELGININEIPNLCIEPVAATPVAA